MTMMNVIIKNPSTRPQMSMILAIGNLHTPPTIEDTTVVVGRRPCLLNALVTYGRRFWAVSESMDIAQ